MSDFVEILRNVIARRIAPDRLRDSMGEIVVEPGTFTPTITFSAPGTLSVAYTVQSGVYRRIESLVAFSVRVDGTPTLGTASGELRIAGLPVARLSTGQADVSPVRLIGADVTWPSGHTALAALISPGEDWIEIEFQGSSEAGTNLVASHITSGNSLGVIVTGTYLTD